MRPEADYFYDILFGYYLVNESMLNIDPPRIRSLQVAD